MMLTRWQPITQGGPCNNASHFWGLRRELLVLDGDLRNTGVRQVEWMVWFQVDGQWV